MTLLLKLADVLSFLLTVTEGAGVAVSAVAHEASVAARAVSVRARHVIAEVPN